MYKLFIAWRYLHTKLIAFFGIASVTLCVAMVLVVLSVMGGFLDTIRERSRGLLGEIILDPGSLVGFPYYEEFADYVQEKLPDVIMVTTPVIHTYALFRIPAMGYTKTCQVLGIRQDEYVRVNEFADGLYYDRYYPDTTHLGPQGMPVGGFTESGALELPAEYEAANAKWRERETDQSVIEEFDANPFEFAQYPSVGSLGPTSRVYAVDLGAPRFAGAKRDGIIVGSDVLFKRSADGNFGRWLARGADVALALIPLSPTGTATSEPPIRWAVRYADDSRTGIYEIDSHSVYVDFDAIQHKLAMDPQPLADGGFTQARTNQLLIGLHDGVNLNAARDAITDVWQEFHASLGPDISKNDTQALAFVDVLTWEDLQRPYIAAVEKEKVLVTFLFSLISIVAIVLLGCIFYMIVEKKTRDIGTLKALGASARGVGSIFIGYAFAVGVTGSVLGTIVGALFVWNINDIQDFLAALNPELRVWSPDVYSFDKIPEIVKTADAVGVALVAVASSMVGSLIPAALAGRVWPVKALRYE